jgi:ATP-dependent RNA helicase RhlE
MWTWAFTRHRTNLGIAYKNKDLKTSATFSKDIKKLWAFCTIPFYVEATPENTTVDAIIKKSISCSKRKTELIIKLIEGNWKQILPPVPKKKQ